MASRESRAAAGAAGVVASPQDEKPTPKKKRSADRGPLHDPKTQAEILRPERLKLTLSLGGKKRKYSLPSEFTIGQIERGIYEDIHFAHQLYGATLARIAPEMQSEGGEFLKKNPRYIELALMRSNVREAVRDLISRLGRFDDVERDDADRPLSPLRASTQQLEEGLSEVDYFIAALWIFGNLTRVRDATAKNSQRTESD